MQYKRRRSTFFDIGVFVVLSEEHEIFDSQIHSEWKQFTISGEYALRMMWPGSVQP